MPVVQEGSSFQLTWTLTTSQPVTITRLLPLPETELATLPATATNYVDVISGIAEGDSVSWKVYGTVTHDEVILTDTAADPTDDPYTYGEPDPTGTAIRYTSLAAVKSRLGISGTSYDTALTQTIIAAELQMDLHIGRAFPDEGTNPQYSSIPIPIKEAATNIAIAVWKMGDSPTGTIDSEFLGTVDVAGAVRRQFNNNPLLYSFQVSWGVA